MRVRKVSRDALSETSRANWADRRRRPFVDGDTAYIPVKAGEPYDCEVPDRHRYTGRGYYLIADIAVIHGRRPTEDEIDAIVSFRRPRGVLWIESLTDITRTPKTHVLYGTAGEVIHRECGYSFVLDPEKVMFSQGNRSEKQRIAGLARRDPAGSRVADMFAGIGYFTIPLAGAGSTVHAMEINPIAFGYLQRNIVRNRLGDRVVAGLGDCRDLLDGIYDRIVMGHFDAPAILPYVLTHVRAGSVIHVHSIGDESERIRSAVEEAGFSATIVVHKVKKYRPHAWHVVQDVTLG